MRILPVLLVALSALTNASAAVAGDASDVGAVDAPVPAGRVTLRSATFWSDVAYDDDGVRVDDVPHLSVETLSLDASLALAPRLTLALRLPFVIAGSDAGGAGGGDDVVSGFGDAVFGLQLGVLNDAPFRFGLRGDAKVPLYDGAPTRLGRDDGKRAAVGDGQVDVTVSGVIDATFPFDGALHWDTGYRLRTGDVSDAVVGGGELGVAVFDGALWPSWRLRFVYSLDPRVVDDVAVEAVGAGAVSTGPGCRVALPFVARGLALDLGVAYVFRGRNAAGGFDLGFGVSYEF